MSTKAIDAPGARRDSDHTEQTHLVGIQRRMSHHEVDNQVHRDNEHSPG